MSRSSICTEAMAPSRVKQETQNQQRLKEQAKLAEDEEQMKGEQERRRQQQEEEEAHAAGAEIAVNSDRPMTEANQDAILTQEMQDREYAKHLQLAQIARMHSQRATQATQVPRAQPQHAAEAAHDFVSGSQSQRVSQAGLQPRVPPQPGAETAHPARATSPGDSHAAPAPRVVSQHGSDEEVRHFAMAESRQVSQAAEATRAQSRDDEEAVAVAQDQLEMKAAQPQRVSQAAPVTNSQPLSAEEAGHLRMAQTHWETEAAHIATAQAERDMHEASVVRAQTQRMSVGEQPRRRRMSSVELDPEEISRLSQGVDTDEVLALQLQNMELLIDRQRHEMAARARRVNFSAHAPVRASQSASYVRKEHVHSTFRRTKSCLSDADSDVVVNQVPTSASLPRAQLEVDPDDLLYPDFEDDGEASAFKSPVRRRRSLKKKLFGKGKK